jgi:5'-nucleotidase
MNILLTNDDGINATGINLVFDILSKKHNVYVVAPMEHMSAKSCSITIFRTLKFDVLSKNKIALDGTPADCVSFALSYFEDIKFDLLISGVNYGFNISYDTLYSGTIGACIQATLNHLPSIAISCDGNFELVEEHLEKTFEYIVNNYFPKGEYLINVNFPIGNEIKGHKLSKLYLRNDKHWIIQNGNEIRFQRELDNDMTLDDSDWYLVNNGYVSITPLKPFIFKMKAII